MIVTDILARKMYRHVQESHEAFMLTFCSMYSYRLTSDWGGGAVPIICVSVSFYHQSDVGVLIVQCYRTGRVHSHVESSIHICLMRNVNL